MHASPRARRQLDRAVYHPPRALGVITGSGLAAWAALAAVIILFAVVDKPASTKTFVGWTVGGLLIALALLFAWWSYCLATLTYTIERGALAIRWGPSTISIPIQAIDRMVPGRTLDVGRVNGLNWWGCHVGGARVGRIGETLVFSTHSRPDEVLYVVTSYGSFALTVLNQAAFAEDIQARAAIAPVQPSHRPQMAMAGMGFIGLGRDRIFLAALILSIGLCAVLAGYVFARYPALPDVVELHFPALGGLVRVGDKAEILRIAYAGVGIVIANAVIAMFIHSRERAAAVWLVASSGLIQAVLIGAAITAMHRA